MYDRFTVYGVEASYFTRKVLALLAYKGLPTDFRRKTLMVAPEVEARAGTRLMPVVVTPEGEWLWDSTPIAFAMERRFPESPVLPPTPVLHVTARILEDFFDEWPTRQALHFRWYYAPDREHGGGSVARDILGIAQDAPLDAEGEAMVEKARASVESWATRTAAAVGADAAAREEMTGEFVRLVAILDRHFADVPFLLGDRPTLPDFALAGGLAAHFLYDPTPRGLIERHGPNLIAYHERLQAARADSVPPWSENDGFAETLAPLLQHVALGFHNFLKANHAALSAGHKELTLDLGYGARRLSTRRYTERTRAETAAALAGLDPAARSRAEAALAPLGVLEALRLPAIV
ncbi:MAG: glutathione S-transferase family protein [Rhodothalassiaceae bacterium]